MAIAGMCKLCTATPLLCERRNCIAFIDALPKLRRVAAPVKSTQSPSFGHNLCSDRYSHLSATATTRQSDFHVRRFLRNKQAVPRPFVGTCIF
jgi:hypothetical protein